MLSGMVEKTKIAGVFVGRIGVMFVVEGQRLLVFRGLALSPLYPYRWLVQTLAAFGQRRSIVRCFLPAVSKVER